MSRPQRIAEGCFRLRLGIVNAYLLVRPNALTLVDCGMPGSLPRIERSLRSLGFELTDLRYILLTHAHPDHAGALAELQSRAPQAITSMHPSEAALVRQGIGMHPDRPLIPAPGFHNWLLFHTMIARLSPKIPAARVDSELHDGQQLNIGEGLSVIATPGHTRGHLSFLLRSHSGVLFAGDVACCLWGPSYCIAYENFEVAKETLRTISNIPIECLCFGHGRPLLRRGDRQLATTFCRETASELVPATDALSCSTTVDGPHQPEPRGYS